MTKKKVVGVLVIIAAIVSALIAILDDNPDTQPNVGATIEEVQDGIGMLREEASDVVVPVPVVEPEQ